MNFQKSVIAATVLMGTIFISAQVAADQHNKMTKSSYSDSVEYDTYRTDKSPYIVRASELIGEDVENAKDNEIGEIDDLIYSKSDDKVYVVISVGGFLGMGDKLVAVPYNKLRVSADGDDVYLNATEEMLKTSPEFKYNKGELSGKDRMSQSDKKSGKAYSDSVEYEKYRIGNSAYNVRASELIGEDVENAKDKEIGEIDDLVYSKSDNIFYAIISVGGFLGIGDKLVAVPYNEIRLSADGDDVYLDITEEMLKAKPDFKYNESESLGKDRISKRNSKNNFAKSLNYEQYRDVKSAYSVRASELIGADVENSKGNDIGDIDDLVYSKTDQQFYAIVSIGGFLGISDKLVAIPYNQLRVSIDGEHVYLDATEEMLKSGPEFKYNDGEITGKAIFTNRLKKELNCVLKVAHRHEPSM